MRLTPQYGQTKAVEYRDKVFHLIRKRYGTKALSVVSLAGARCLSNPQSIERRLLAINKNTIVRIAERNSRSFNKIVACLTNVVDVPIRNSQLIVKHGKYRGSDVIVVRASLRRCLKYMQASGIRCDVGILDYFCSLNHDVEKDLNIILGGQLIHKRASLFLTASDNPRIRGTRTYRRILAYSSGTGNYLTGLKTFIRKKTERRGYRVKSMLGWKYKDNPSSAGDMKVVHIDLAA
jgi:hypothetical protein